MGKGDLGMGRGETSFHDGVGRDCKDDDRSSQIEARVEIFVLLKDEGGEKYSVDWFQIVGEVDRKDAEAFEEFDVLGESDDRTEDGEDDEPEPIERSRGEGDFALQNQEEGERKQAGSGHFVEGDDQMVGFGDVEAVDDRKRRGQKSRQNGDEKSMTVFQFAPIDDGNTDEDDGAKDQVDGAQFPLLDQQWFEDRGPK